MRIIEYSPESQRLIVELHQFPYYEIFDLPEDVFSNLQRTEDQEAYFNEHIWGSKFEHNSHWRSLEALLLYIEDNFTFESPVITSSRAGDGDTPLHFAATWGDLGAIELLLLAGAEVNARGDMECTPLYNAVTCGHIRSAALLLKAGASPTDENDLATSALRAARESENPLMHALFKDET